MPRAELVREVNRLFEIVVCKYPGSREPLRSRVAHQLEIEAQRRDKNEAFTSWLRELHESIADHSVGGRLRQHAGHIRWGIAEPPPGLYDLVAEIIEQPEVIASQWGWLTSGGAHNAAEFGAILGNRDVHGAFAAFLECREDWGPDQRMVAAYLKAQSAHRPSGWLDDRLEERSANYTDDAGLVLDLICHVGHASVRSARSVLSLLREGTLPPDAFNRLMFSRWSIGLPPAEFRELIGDLARYPELRNTALFLVFLRLQQSPDEVEDLQVLAVGLVTDPALLRSDQLHVWQAVARLLVRSHARAIARTALTAHGEGLDFWYFADSPDQEVVVGCIEVDPEGVWTELSRFLEHPDGREEFVTNLPSGLVDRFPRDLVLGWSAVSPDRPLLLAQLTAPTFGDDQSLAASLADKHGHRDDVSRVLFGQLIGRAAYDGSSGGWAERAANLEKAALSTARSGLRRWASRAAEECRELELLYRIQEEEGRIGG